MKKLFVIILFVATVIATLTFSPLSALAGDAAVVTEGDRRNLLSNTGYQLEEGYYVEIAYDNYTLYSSGLYQAFTVTFDSAFWEGYSSDENGINYRNNILEAFNLLFTGRGFQTEVDRENARFIAFVKYDSYTDYYIDADINGYKTSEDNSVKNKGFLFTESEQKTTTPFVNIEKEGYLLNAILQICYQAGIERDNVALTYIYGTPYKIINTDSDDVNYASGQKIYLHTFNMNMDSYDREITLTQKSPNTTGWYILAVIIGLVFLAIPLIITFTKRKKGGENAKK